MTAAWSVNRMAARAVAVHGGSDAAELLAMLGLVDESGRLLPDDTAVYAMNDLIKGPGARDPNSESPRVAAESGRRPAGMTTPAGLATLTPISEQPVSKPRKQRERKPPKPPRQLAKCGTYSGYSKHRRLKEQACEECHVAAQQYRRDYMARYRTDGREPPRKRRSVCGTTGGWSRHKRLHEKACRACLDAKNAYWRVRNANRRAAAVAAGAPLRQVHPECGTADGFVKHRRLKTAFCDPCRDAYELANPTVDCYPMEKSA